MATSKQSDSARAGRSVRAAHERQPAAVPPGWFAALATLILVPWLIAGVLYLGAAGRTTPAAVSATPAHPAKDAAPGPWGRLTVKPVIVSPPLEYVAADWGRREEPDAWFFPGTTTAALDAFFASAGLRAGDVARLRASAVPLPGINGLAVTPDADLVRALTPEVRSALYAQLAKTTLNFDQANAFRFLGATAGDWFDGTSISARTRALIEPLIYRDGDFLAFADVEVIRAAVGDREELRRLAKVLLRQATVLVRLSIDNPEDVDGLADYWGRGGRRLDLRPLLESAAGTGPEGSIDILHLLPTFARHHLYRYPKISTADYAKPLLANCLWSSLNFFAADPDDRFLDVHTALEALKRDYYVIEHGYQLGDIVGFVDEEGDLFHAAVYIADDLLFTKNGTSPMAPWTIVSTEYLKGYYSRHAGGMRLIYHRRNEF